MHHGHVSINGGEIAVLSNLAGEHANGQDAEWRKSSVHVQIHTNNNILVAFDLSPAQAGALGNMLIAAAHSASAEPEMQVAA